jgi:hypothetical protein
MSIVNIYIAPRRAPRRIEVAMLAGQLAIAISLMAAPLTAAPPVKHVLRTDTQSPNLLRPDAWRPYEQGFAGSAQAPVCDNGPDSKGRRGLVQTVVLNQQRPEPIVAVATSKAEGVTGAADHDYSLYLDLDYVDGTPLWGQVAPFGVGNHDWQTRQVLIMPEKPIKQVAFYLLLRGHGGKAAFRDASLRAMETPAGACLFDGVPVANTGPAREGFLLRDVAADGDYRPLEGKDAGHVRAGVMRAIQAGVQATWRFRGQTQRRDGSTGDTRTCWLDLHETTGKDRAISLVYVLPVAGKHLRWLAGPRQESEVVPGREYVEASRFRAGSNGRLSRWPLAAVAAGGRGQAIAIDPDHPLFNRLGYNAGTGELFAAFDIGLTAEHPYAQLVFETYPFDAAGGFRAALARYYDLHPEQFTCRTPEQGLWMPFAKISQVQGWQDFGFKFKEGNDETAWDNAHGILTFRYTEPMTWWMSAPKGTPHTREAAEAVARRLAEQGNLAAQALFSSGFRDAEGRLVARPCDSPWCDGAVWSMNSMPRIKGQATDFRNKWNDTIARQFYVFGPLGKGLAGEYIDSSEGYVTDELDFCREHFGVADTPLTFSLDERRPAIFRGLIAYEYIRGMSGDLRRRQRLLMANATPGDLWWLAPLLDVMGTEIDWNPGGRWQPMSDAALLYRRALTKGKPYCFLMNTRFERFPPALVEKYMKRSAAYGMFPGFFSHNAAEDQYFTRPALYNRDRPLFKKYVPLCKRLAEAGWQVITHASSDDPQMHVERFGQRWLTVFNDSPRRRTATIALDDAGIRTVRELLTGRPIVVSAGRFSLTLDGEDLAVIEME